MQLLQQIQDLEFPAPLPETLLHVGQRFDATRVEDVSTAVTRALRESGFLTQIAPGDSVAVAVGSRGIANLPLIVKTVIQQLQDVGAAPFIFPAMGSHAGATAEGQRGLLAKLGVTSETVGAEVRATMDVTEIGQLPGGPPLYQDAMAAQADHTILINRVKPHTSFRSHIESGLAKMEVIGLGKRQGAELMHALGPAGFERFLAPAAQLYAERTNVIGGLAIVENAYEETHEIVGLTASEIGGPKEAALLEKARSLMPSLPFSEIDVLVVQRMGKNVSGTGMDTNIIGRHLIPRQPPYPDGPDVAVIVVLDLTPETHGNANGLGLANVTTARVAQKVDWRATYMNAITAGIFAIGRSGLPITMADDRRALQVAVRGCGVPYHSARFVFIQDTLTLDRLWVSSNLRAEVEAHPRLSLVGETALQFRKDGVMVSPWRMNG